MANPQRSNAGIANQTPTDYEGINVPILTQGIYHECPSSYSNPIILHSASMISGMIASGSLSKLDADQYRYLYLLLLDGGDTQALEEYVQNTWGAQVWATKEHLLTLSPYLTTTVILGVLDNTNIYPHAIAFEILMANPDLLGDPKLASYLGTKSDPMPQYMIDLLLGYAVGSTSRTEMEKFLAEKRTKHISTVSSALWAMTDYEDDTYTKDDIDNLISDVQSLNTEIMTVENLLNDGKITQAEQRLLNIPSILPFGKGEFEEFEAYKQWFNLRKDMLNNGREWETMIPSDIIELENIITHFDTYAAAAAMEILNAHTEADYFVPPAFGSMGNTFRSARLSQGEIADQLIDVYPNPADYMTTIRFKEALPTSENCELIVVDLMGKTVLQSKLNSQLGQYVVNTKGWAEGVYTFRIALGETQITFAGKFEVVH